jgi:hypothetical protein
MKYCVLVYLVLFNWIFWSGWAFTGLCLNPQWIGGFFLLGNLVGCFGGALVDLALTVGQLVRKRYPTTLGTQHDESPTKWYRFVNWLGASSACYLLMLLIFQN